MLIGNKISAIGTPRDCLWTTLTTGDCPKFKFTINSYELFLLEFFKLFELLQPISFLTAHKQMNFKLKVAYSKGLVIISLKEVQRDYSASPDGVQASQTTPTAEVLASQ